VNRRGISVPVVLSFNEFVWLFAFAMTLLYVYQVSQTRNVSVELAEHVNANTGGDAARAATIRRELVGLRGELKTVVFVVDRSNSMTSGNRWATVRSTIQSWIRYLDVDQCALVLFNQSVESYPVDGSYLMLSGEAGARNREALVNHLDTVMPKGRTNTLAALRRAYEYHNVDTIVLFTDGVPDLRGRGFDRRMTSDIYDLVRQHGQSVPINTVGVGNYFSPAFGNFLRRLPELTGGTFIGR
jgi:Mg-chelatase subunit ChlD